MEVKLYIKGTQADFFEDENLEINLNVKTVNDLSKLFTDFSQSFSLPCTKNNNQIFEHWYNADVNGNFNVNIRVEAYLEVNSLPFRYGTVQLESVKMSKNLPYSYSCTFFGAVVNLSDLFGELELKDLESLADFNHDYLPADVIQSISGTNLFNGDIYYPLISSTGEMSLGTVNSRDLQKSDNGISYREFKPALREIRIIEAIEQKFGITFSRDFFDRSVFYNLFLWLQKDAGYLKVYGNEQRVDLQSESGFSDIEMTVDTTNDTITFVPSEIVSGDVIKRQFIIQVFAESGYDNVSYKLRIYKGTELINEGEFTGNALMPLNDGNNPLTLNQYHITISSDTTFLYTTKVRGSKTVSTLFPINITTTNRIMINSSVSTSLSSIDIPSIMPELKIKDYITSLINKFNLVIVPINGFNFYIDTLDNWYSKGKIYNINKYVDIEDTQIKRPDVKKKIEFLYQKTEYILGKKYFENNQIGYGDLKATYDISGSELKIETQFENMLFERLEIESTGDLTELQVGFAIDKNLEATKGKPIRFYRNGLEYCENTIFVQPETAINEVWHTATEDNKNVTQVTNSLNFGDNISSYFYTPIEQSLYKNWWSGYIEDLFNKKCRVLSFTCYLPSNILYRLKMNDKFIIQDRKYKISSVKANLVTGKCSIEVFSDFDTPTDTIDNIIPLTVDNTNITVDSDTITTDTVSTYSPLYSFVTNGISISNYTATKGEEYFEVKVTANTNWSISNVNSDAWISTNKTIGNKTDFVRVKINANTSTTRAGILRFTIGGTNYDLNIIQE